MKLQIQCGVVLFALGISQSQTGNQQASQPSTTARVRGASSLIGTPVQLNSGDKIGTVKDFVISENSIASVIVASQDELILVPFDLCEVDFDRVAIIIDVDRERVLRFERVRRLNEFRTLSALLRTSIQLQAGATFGVLEDIFISSRGRFDFVVIAFQERFLAVPFNLTRLDFQRQMVSINITRERLLQAPTFNRSQFPNMAVNSAFMTRVNNFFQPEIGIHERGTEPRTPMNRPAETRPMEKRPMETRPPETRPAEKKPPETRPMEKRPPETQPMEKRPSEVQPMEKRHPIEKKPPMKQPPEKKTPVEKKTPEKEGI